MSEHAGADIDQHEQPAVELTAPGQEHGSIWQRAGKAALLSGLFLAGATPTAAYELSHESTTANIATHDATVRFTGDGYATVDMGPYVPSFRKPSGALLHRGLYIDAGKSSTDNADKLPAIYAAIAAQPSGLEEKLHDVADELLIAAGLKSGAVGAILPAMYLLVGSRRRKELRESVVAHRRRSLTVVTCGALAVSGCGVAGYPFESPTTDVGWIGLSEAFPELANDPDVATIEISNDAVSQKERELVSGAIKGYEKSKVFYRNLADRAKEVGRRLRQPQKGDMVALFISDRHDNIGMDPVWHNIGIAGGATILMSAGDETSAGQPWESFSLDSLIANAKGFPDVIEEPGNHDPGNFVSDYLTKHSKIKVLDKKEVTVQGIRILGAPDIRSSSLVNSPDFDSANMDGESDELADIACKQAAAGKRVNTLLVHEPRTGAEALKRGCVDLVAAGHLHRYVGPTTVVGENGQVGTSFVTNTAGAAALAMALGPMRRDAGVSLITYHKGVPIGIQKVAMTKEGDIIPEVFDELPAYSTYYSSDGSPDVRFALSRPDGSRATVRAGVRKE